MINYLDDVQLTLLERNANMLISKGYSNIFNPYEILILINTTREQSTLRFALQEMYDAFVEGEDFSTDAQRRRMRLALTKARTLLDK